MPANLPPEYYEAEARFKRAVTGQEKVSSLEALIATVPKHKGTDKLRADLRRRLSRLREESLRKKKSGRTDIYSVERQGASQAALVGLPNSGKSSLLGLITNAKPIIAEYPSTTLVPLSGMMPYQDIQFQLVDLPPIGNESTDGWVSGILRSANILLLILDLSDDARTQAGLLLEQLQEWRIPIAGRDCSKDVAHDRFCKPAILVANKCDLVATEEMLRTLRAEYEPLFPVVCTSVTTGRGGEELAGVIFRLSNIIRVYTKAPGKEADLHKPYTMMKGSSLLDLAQQIHKDFISNFKYACVWGSARFDGQRVQKDYILEDGDIVEYHQR